MALQICQFEILIIFALLFPVFMVAFLEDEICTNDICSSVDINFTRTDGSDGRGGMGTGGGTGNGTGEVANGFSCDPLICRGEGECYAKNREVICKCLEQYFIGSYCNVETDHCKYTGVFEPCDPFGTEQCIPYFGGRNCVCRKGYYGTDCHKKAKAPFDELVLRSAPSPMVYFLHENVEGGSYEMYITVENVSDTHGLTLSISGRGYREFDIIDLKRNYKLSKFMGLPNVPNKIRQNYYVIVSHQFQNPGLFMVKLELHNSKGLFSWTTTHYFPGRTLKKTLQYGHCPPKIILTGTGGVCYPNKRTDEYLPVLTENIKYMFYFNLIPCLDEHEETKLNYFVTDLFDASLVIRAEGKRGTSYAQCFVRFQPKRPNEPYSEVVRGKSTRDDMLRKEEYDPDDPDYEKEDVDD
ncbi:uncharacterized protein LOC123290642 [Chrysoperla carnea]|uniref:uncharacterized protein LOC123290642 n=1 Tax=Chrysoperla carnea TaxID=189513 RepID=UPI001D0692B7|nr:uncharacterized protein LOC123290642 [Chrysoperla carnea]